MTNRINRPLKYSLDLNPDHPYLNARGVDVKLASHFGIGYCNHFLMDDRIAIPIHDQHGQLVAYGGRWIGTEVPQGEKKYRYTPGFKKSLVLYNLHQVKGRTVDIVLVEGFFSVFRLHKLDVPAVALIGHTLSMEQEELLIASEAKIIAIMLNGNTSSRQSQRSMVARLARWFLVRSVELPGGKEPDTVDERILRKARL